MGIVSALDADSPMCNIFPGCGLYKNATMKPENKAYLEIHRPIWDSLRQAEYLRFPSMSVPGELLRIMREEFRPGYTVDMWCGHCVAEMVRQVYTEFEKWEASQPILSVQWEDRQPYFVKMEMKEDSVQPVVDPEDPVFTINPDPPPIPEGHAEAVEIKDNGEIVKTIEPFTPPIPVKANFPKHNKNHRR